MASWCPHPVGPVGTTGWATGLSEQARGTGQATNTGVAGPPAVPTNPNNLLSLTTAIGSIVGGSAAGPLLAAATGASKKSKSLLKLLQYNGTDSVVTFLAKFTCMAEYLQWNESDKFHHLCASLKGAAGQVLWGIGPNANASTVVGLLWTRFGNEMQVEHFHAELRARRHKPGETLQMLYLDICKMVSLAHQLLASKLTMHVAKQ